MQALNNDDSKTMIENAETIYEKTEIVARG